MPALCLWFDAMVVNDINNESFRLLFRILNVLHCYRSAFALVNCFGLLLMLCLLGAVFSFDIVDVVKVPARAFSLSVRSSRR